MNRVRWAVTIGALALAVTTLGLTGAGAQPATTHDTISNIPVTTDASGFATLAEAGTADGVLAIHCGPAAPQAGSVIPSLLTTHLEGPSTRLRFQQAGRDALGRFNPSVANRTVYVNCTIKATSPAPVTALDAR